MAVNVFAGARRVALTIAVVATIITIILLVMYKPYAPIRYGVRTPYGPFERTEESCPDEGSTHYFSVTTSKGKGSNVSVCFFPMEFEDGKRLIPYKVDEKGMIWGASRYTPEVTDYQSKMEKRFKLSPSDEQDIAKESSRLYRQKMMEGLGCLAIGLLLFSGVVWVIGWIVRGFLGIPQGMDSRDTMSADN
uniref:Uncharacterized protein n=1 Tax=Geobacter sp. (strain M21) TaxID=443144 RepID=C6E3Q5_GEOSM